MNYEPEDTQAAYMTIQELMDTISEVRFSDLDKDYSCCLALLDISEKESYLYGTAYAYAYLGDCYLGKNDSVNAGIYLMKALKICEAQHYFELLLNVYIWTGIFYEMQYDRQLAMHYNLEALDLADSLKDQLRKSVVTNNIANQFQICKEYALAKQYFLDAFHLFTGLGIALGSNPHFAQMISNILGVCCIIGQIEEAEHYLYILEHSELHEVNRSQLYLSKILIATVRKDIEAAHFNTDKLLNEMEKFNKNRHQFFEALLNVADSLLTLKEPVYAKKTLLALNSLLGEEEHGRKLQVQYIWTRYHEMFSGEDKQFTAYKQFYQLKLINDQIVDRAIAEGLISKIMLRESVKENEEISLMKMQWESEAQLDAMTQLYNRRSFKKRVDEAVVDQEIHRLCFVMIDVDYFKEYNDTYGHAKGDETLRAVADCMSMASDKEIDNFRYGGDEYVAMCKNKSISQVEEFIKTVTAMLHHRHIPHKNSQCSEEVTLSIGYSLHTRQEEETIDAVGLLAEADCALYWSKGRGRNCSYQFYEEMRNA